MQQEAHKQQLTVGQKSAVGDMADLEAYGVSAAKQAT